MSVIKYFRIKVRRRSFRVKHIIISYIKIIYFNFSSNTDNNIFLLFVIIIIYSLYAQGGLGRGT